MKRLIGLFVVMVLLMGTTMSVCAVSDVESAADQIQPRYTNINKLTASLKISTSGKANWGGLVAAHDTKANVSLKAELQKKSGSQWKTVESDNTSGIRQTTVTNATYVVKGTYRVKVTGKVGSETGTAYSSIVTY